VADRQHAAINPEIRLHIFRIFERLARIPLEFSKPEDREYGNRIYEIVFSGYDATIRAARDDPEFLFGSRIAFFQPVNGYTRLSGYMSDASLKAFVGFIRTALEFLPNRCGVILNRKIHYAVLLWGESSADKVLAKEARDVLGALHVGHYMEFLAKNAERADGGNLKPGENARDAYTYQ
jgi:hypothetical protein